MTDNVVKLNLVPDESPPAKDVLKEALDLNLVDVVVIGTTKDGARFISSSYDDFGWCVYCIEDAKYQLFQLFHAVPNEGDEE